MDLQKWYWKERPGMADDRDRWQFVVDAVMNLRVPKKCGEFLDWLLMDSALCS